MALPKIQYPTFEVKVPILDKSITMRPMLVKEEKILLMAKQSGEREDQMNAIKQIVNNCLVDESQGFDLNTFPFVALEYMFIKLRAMSINNVVEVQYRLSDDETADYKIDLDKVEIRNLDKLDDAPLKINNDIAIKLRYPTVGTYTNAEFFKLDQKDLLDYILTDSIAMIYDKETVHDVSMVGKAEITEFVNSIPAKAYQDIQKFFDAAPSLYYKLTIGEGETEQDIELTTIDDFFTFV